MITGLQEDANVEHAVRDGGSAPPAMETVMVNKALNVDEMYEVDMDER